MNFYSDIIINDAIDNFPLENVIDFIEKFGEDCFNLINRYARDQIQDIYTFNVLSNTKNVVAFHCIDNEFTIENCPSILVYRKCKFKPTKNLIRPADSHSSWSMTDKEINPSPEGTDLNLQRFKNSVRYYILLACTKRKFRNQGYASKLLDGVIKRIKEETKQENAGNINSDIKIILSSVEESVLFYESYGFKWTRESITDHKMLMSFERYQPDKEYFIMELKI
uniref:N-acetyltransferase domain-containing protein n=1 Tax=viral metagenome TaxID=1070528 RepID=A0A6C0DKL6_9ZZZZ